MGLDRISPYRIPLQTLLMAMLSYSNSATKFWLDAYERLRVLHFCTYVTVIETGKLVYILHDGILFIYNNFSNIVINISIIIVLFPYFICL